MLAVQAVLSLRLIGADTAFQDEALYLWAGHLEWARLLHGTPIPQFSSYFSGAPVIYPPLAALADRIGGLAGARLLSLVFMLAVTVLLWVITDRLFGPRPAFFAAALFAVLGPTLHLGAFATYDAMALFLLALATWFVVQAGERQDATGWMIAAGAALALANATAYSSALFDPVVLLLALIVALPKPGGRLAAARVLTLLAILAVILTPALLLGGSRYLHGIDVTTLERAPGADPPVTVFAHFSSWTGVILVAACCGVVFGWVSGPGSVRAWLLTLLAAAGLLVPIEQASLYTTASLNKHGAMGAWFAAIAAGYAVGKLIETSIAGTMRLVTAAACVIALCYPLMLGASQSRTFATSWPNVSAFITIFRPIADNGTGRMLVEDPSVAEYYLPSGNQWQRWSSTRNIVLPGGTPTGGPSKTAGVVGAGDAGTFAMYIREGYFSVIALNFADTASLDKSIAADIHGNHHYHPVQVVPYGDGPAGPAPGEYVIWKYEPQS
ncbi:MAG: glycosyltransferase family 39 protein [Actinobacteria bacterium]|nr:glycosyltransferase family 39 protein [Actinomycetota bacterium]